MSARTTRPRGRPTNPEAREARRRQILDAARHCFMARGFHAASTADISQAAGVSVANLYQYFPSKEDLVLAIADEYLKEELAFGDALTRPGDLLDRLEKVFVAAAEQAERRDVFSLRMEIFAEAMRNPEMHALHVHMDARMARGLARHVEKAQSHGEIAKDLDPHAVAALILRLLDGLYVAVGVGLIGGKGMIPHFGQLLRHGLARRQPGR